MYLRHTTLRKDGKVHRYWRLVRSVRIGRRVIQQTVAHLGELDQHGRLEARALARHLIGVPEESQLFDDGSRDVTVPVRLKGIHIERSRQFGDVYLALALWRGMGLEDLCERLLPAGKERIGWAKMAAVLVAARFCEPSSELHIAEDWYRRTALSDLLQLDDEEVNKDRLYRGLDHLLAHKADLEAHLSERCGELFAIQNEVLLYDVTSTYFEGQAEANPQAKRGYSRDHRPDGWRTVHEGVEVKLTRHPETDETVIVCRSADRRSKERAMHEKFSGRIEAALERLSARLARSKKRLDPAQVNRQIGRILQQNQRAAARFEVELKPDSCPAGFRLHVACNASFDDWAALSEGAYLLRSNITDWSEQHLWKAYIQLTQVEAAFRIQKDQLNVRPIWHQREDRVQAHILVCFLAFVLWKSLEMWQQRAGLGNSPRTILEELARIQSHDVVLPTTTHRQIRLRCVTQPDAAQAALLERLGIVLPKRMRLPEQELTALTASA